MARPHGLRACGVLEVRLGESPLRVGQSGALFTRPGALREFIKELDRSGVADRSLWGGCLDFLTAHGAAILFYLFAAVAVVAACFVVTMRNPMYSAIALLVTFLSVAALFLLLHAEFVAFVQVFVYGGGIMVLFLFVIMLVNLHRLKETRLFGENAPLAAVVGLLLLALFGSLFVGMTFAPVDVAPAAFVNVEGVARGNTEAVAWSLYRDYLLPFEIVSVFLLVAMVGAVVLGRKQ